MKESEYTVRDATLGTPSQVVPTLSNSGSFLGSASGSAGRSSQTLKRSIVKRNARMAAETMPTLIVISVQAGM